MINTTKAAMAVVPAGNDEQQFHWPRANNRVSKCR